MTTSTFGTSLDTTRGKDPTKRWTRMGGMHGRRMHCESEDVSLPVGSFRVVALSMSPVDDTFISGSLDKTIRLWDLRSPNCQVSEAKRGSGWQISSSSRGCSGTKWFQITCPGSSAISVAVDEVLSEWHASFFLKPLRADYDCDSPLPLRAWCTYRESRCARSIQRVWSSQRGSTLRWLSFMTCAHLTRWGWLQWLMIGLTLSLSVVMGLEIYLNQIWSDAFKSKQWLCCI